jgi:flagellar protein FlaF
VKRILQYGIPSTVSNVSAQDSEIMAFTVANTYLEESSDQFSRTKALHKNQQLWSLLIKDVMKKDNRLPEPLKEQIINLGLWAMAYSVRAMGWDLPLNPLIEVNRNMIAGLRRQMQFTAVARERQPQSMHMAV